MCLQGSDDFLGAFCAALSFGRDLGSLVRDWLIAVCTEERQSFCQIEVW